MRILLVVILLVFVALFLAGVFAPERSRRMQSWVRRKLRRAERKGDRNAGKLGDVTNTMLEKSRHGADKSAESGRKVHDKAAEAASGLRDRLSG